MESHEETAYLGLGSNLGNRMKNLEMAYAAIAGHPDIRVTASSSYYETEPVGFRNQGWFINQVLRIETILSPYEILKVTQYTEHHLGRKREIPWGPRSIDIDVLLYGNKVMEDPDLIIPHPHLTERRFVLIPLSEIAPSLIHPVMGKSIEDILSELSVVDRVEKV